MIKTTSRAPLAHASADFAERPLFALEHIRRMRGGSQAHLMRCSDDNYYVVKFQGNPQGSRILANEFLATRLAERLGLPIAVNHVVHVSKKLINDTKEMVFELARGSIPCTYGLCFGSRFPVDPRQQQTAELLSDGLFDHLENISDFCGMLVFDKWTGNTDERQTIFFRKGKNFYHNAIMIDQGMCFNGSKWNFPDAPRRCLYYLHPAYRRVSGMDAFEPWITRLEHEVDAEVLMDIASSIPGEWYGFDSSSLYRLLERLDSRRRRVRGLLRSAWQSSLSTFPNWKKWGGIHPVETPASIDPAGSVLFGEDSR